LVIAAALCVVSLQVPESVVVGVNLFGVDLKGPFKLFGSDLQDGKSGVEGVNVGDKIRKPPPKSAPNDKTSTKEEALIGRAKFSTCAIVLRIVRHGIAAPSTGNYTSNLPRWLPGHFARSY